MPSQTLSSRSAIRAVYATRHVAHGTCMSARALARPDPGDPSDPTAGRATVVASRRVGTAVDRNRAKRRLRAVLRSEGVPERLDLVLAAKPAVLAADFQTLLKEYRALCARLLRMVRVAGG